MAANDKSFVYGLVSDTVRAYERISSGTDNFNTRYRCITGGGGEEETHESLSPSPLTTSTSFMQLSTIKVVLTTGRHTPIPAITMTSYCVSHTIIIYAGELLWFLYMI